MKSLTPAQRRSSGVALIIALLLLTLMSILGIGLVLSVSSDSLINGYYGNYRASFYAADSGLKLVRQYMANQFVAQVNETPCNAWGQSSNAGGNCTGYPISSTTSAATTVQSALTSTFGGSFMPLSGSSTSVSGAATGSWASNFTLSSATITSSSGQCTAGTNPCTYTFSYTLTTLGKGPGAQQVRDTESGVFTLAVQANTGAQQSSFSYFGAFINNFAANQAPLVYGTMTGPQWTNGSWNFGNGGTYTFTDPVYQSGPTISYDFGGHWVDSSASSATYNQQTIAPNFEQGIYVNQTAAPLPANDYSQQWAVVDGIGVGETGNLQTQMSAVLQNVSGTAYAGTGTNGVYLPVSGSISGGTAAITGGGFYVEGPVTSITLTPGASAGIETYTIVQGNTTTQITTNTTNNNTTIGQCTGSGCTVSSSSNKTVSGVPHSNVNGNAQTLLYVDGNIGGQSGSGWSATYTGLQGPGGTSNPAAAAIQNGVQLTVVANGNIDVVTNLLYEQEPVTLNSADTAVANASSQTQVLGIFTNNGNIGFYSPYNYSSSDGSVSCTAANNNCTLYQNATNPQSTIPLTDYNSNLEIDGALAMLSNNCSAGSQSCGGIQTLNSIGTMTYVGGRSETNAHSVSMNSENVFYDRRFLNGFGPPFFPSTTVQLSQASAPTPTPSFQRLTWSTSPQN
jgi:Tfp pilus assembly protein PilX